MMIMYGRFSLTCLILQSTIQVLAIRRGFHSQHDFERVLVKGSKGKGKGDKCGIAGGTSRPDDEYERECRLFEYVLQSSSSQVLLFTDLVSSCPCSTATVDVRCQDTVKDCFPGDLPSGCVTENPDETVELPVCGSINQQAGVEAYKAYCLENFGSVRHSVKKQSQTFDDVFTDFVEMVVSLADDENEANILPTTTVQAITSGLDVVLQQALALENIPNQCLEGCAYFVGQACCEDILRTPICTSVSFGSQDGDGGVGEEEGAICNFFYETPLQPQHSTEDSTEEVFQIEYCYLSDEELMT